MGQVASRLAGIRSLLTVDPASPDRYGVSPSAAADAFVVDLAGAGSTRSGPAAAGDMMASFVTRIRSRAYRPLLLVRIGPLDDPSTEGTLDAVMPSCPDGIVLSGCADGAAVQRLGIKLAVREAGLGLADGSTAIVAEAGASAAGLLALASFQEASPRLAALSWDGDALGTDLGGTAGVFNEDEGPRSVVRTLLALGARAARVPALDTASAAHGEALGRECAAARRLGFAGKLARDPAQVAVINAVFAGAYAAPRT